LTGQSDAGHNPRRDPAKKKRKQSRTLSSIILLHKQFRYLKRLIERITGLSLADAINVAIFLLTIFSLIMAGLGVWVGQRTLDDAKTSGKEQTERAGQELNQLADAGKSLKILQSEIQEQGSVVMEQATLLADQLKFAQRALRIEFDARCVPPSTDEALRGFTLPWREIQSHQRHRITVRLPILSNARLISCFIKLSNLGDGNLVRPDFQWQLLSFRRFNRPIQTTWIGEGSGIYTPGTARPDGLGNRAIELTRGRDLLPKSVTGSYETWAFDVQIPADATEFMLAYDLTSANFKPLGGTIAVSLERNANR
jgi:hypothetical protein